LPGRSFEGFNGSGNIRESIGKEIKKLFDGIKVLVNLK